MDEIFSAVGLTALLTGKYRNESPFNFYPILSLSLSLCGFSRARPNRWNRLRICLLQLDGSREQTFKRIGTRETRDERLFTIPKHVRRGYISNTPSERDAVRRVALLEGIGSGENVQQFVPATGCNTTSTIELSAYARNAPNVSPKFRKSSRVFSVARCVAIQAVQRTKTRRVS